MSQTTKNKLNKFLCETAQDDSANNGGPDGSTTGDALVTSKQTVVDNAVTPTVNRLSWKDFMEPDGAAEEDAKTSPNERIMWDNRPCQNGITPVGPRNSKKRARSSSPISSPAFEKKTPTVNVKKLALALKSPHADPTLELWDRFSINKSDETMNAASGITNPALAQLMVSSSPRPSNKMRVGGAGNLRRAVSHGINAPKRRKIENSRSCSVASDEQREMEAASKSSLVTALLENATSSFQEQSPDERSFDQRMDHSPSPQKRSAPIPESCTPPREKNKMTIDNVSDYGDDDFDDDTFMELEAKMTVAETNATFGSLEHEARHTQQTADATKHVPVEILDDTDDELLDKLAKISETSVAANKRDSPSKLTRRGTDTRQPQMVSLDSDDEFGDLDEDFDLEAVELAMTQSLQQASRSNPSVC